MRFVTAAFVLAAALMTSACGGGGSSARTPTPGSSACGGPAARTVITVSCANSSPAAQPTGPAGARLSPASFDGIPASGTMLGRANAPVTIDLYQNFLCPHCRDFALDMLPGVIADYVVPGKAVIRFHDVALGPPAASLAHQAGECAADQGKFWPAYAALYQNFSDDESAYSSANVESWLGAAGVDAAKLGACLDAGTHRADVDASTAAFQHLGDTNAAYRDALATVEAAQGPAIPLIDVSGTYVTAPESYDVVKQAIDARLR